MAKKKVRLNVLAEDAETARFAERVLQAFGVTPRDYRMAAFQGRGSGKQWVSRSYPRFVRELRRRNYQKNLVLVVITDADELTVAQRAKELDNALSGDDQTRRQASDRIVFWIPRWHIETWYLYFNGVAVVETDDYKDQFKKQIGRQERQVGITGFVDEYRRFKSSPMEVTKISLASLVAAYRESLTVPF